MLYTIRKIPILLFILWSLSAQAQSSDISEESNTGAVPEEKNAAFTINIGIGAPAMPECPYEPPLAVDFIPMVNNGRYIYPLVESKINNAYLGFDYNENRTLITADLTYNWNTFSGLKKQKRSWYQNGYGYGNGYDVHRHFEDREFDITYSYLGIKTSFNHAFVIQENFSILLGYFFHYDYLIYKKESNHVMREYTQYTSKNNSIPDGPITNISSNQNIFDGMPLRKAFYFHGLNFLNRYTTNKLTFTLQYNLGFGKYRKRPLLTTSGITNHHKFYPGYPQDASGTSEENYFGYEEQDREGHFRGYMSLRHKVTHQLTLKLGYTINTKIKNTSFNDFTCLEGNGAKGKRNLFDCLLGNGAKGKRYLFVGISPFPKILGSVTFERNFFYREKLRLNANISAGMTHLLSTGINVNYGKKHMIEMGLNGNAIGVNGKHGDISIGYRLENLNGNKTTSKMFKTIVHIPFPAGPGRYSLFGNQLSFGVGDPIIEIACGFKF